MFRYAALMLDQLCRPSNETIEQRLAVIPSGLSGIYVWILEHLDENDLDLRKKVLLWVTMAVRPITVDEMALAYATQGDGPEAKFDPSRKVMAEAKDFLIACGPLVEITPDNTLQFTHFSVKEFLLGHGYDHNILGTGQDAVRECLILDATLAHEFILRTCRK